MSMSYTTLTGSKGSSGALLTWVNYAKLDVGTVVDEAQALLYQILRVREMRTEWTFGVSVGQASVALPTRFLDPIGKVYDLTNVTDYDQFIGTSILKKRAYDNSISGTFGTNPFTTTSGSGLVSVNQTAHGLNQDSAITIPNAPSLNGLTLTGTFPIVSITDANDFVMDVGSASDTTATASGSGGGTGVTYTADNLVAGSPTGWGIWDENLKFDMAADTAFTGKLLLYRRPQPLSATNPTNFVTDRYPHLMRVACLAAAAKFMKDDQEYQKNMTELNTLIQTTASFDDLAYRGASFGTDTP